MCFLCVGKRDSVFMFLMFAEVFFDYIIKGIVAPCVETSIGPMDLLWSGLCQLHLIWVAVSLDVGNPVSSWQQRLRF